MLRSLLAIAFLATASAPAQMARDAKPWVTTYTGCAQGHELPPNQVLTLPESLRSEASALLTAHEVLPLSQDQLTHFTAQTAVFLHGLHPFLVRGLSWSPTNRIFMVYMCGEDLLVGSGALGGHMVVKDPVIVLLPYKPRHLFLSFIGAK